MDPTVEKLTLAQLKDKRRELQRECRYKTSMDKMKEAVK